MSNTPDTANPNAMAPAWELALQANFGSVQGWRDDFAHRADAATGGLLSLCFEPRSGRLLNQGSERVAGVDEERVVLLSFTPGGAHNLDDWLAAVRWADVYERYQHAVHEASAELGAGADAVAGSRVLDVRRAGVFEAAKTMLPDARWCDPAAVAAWAQELPRDAPVLVYCVYGHEVGRATALRLKAVGVDARYLEGGIDEWAKAGRPVIARGIG